MNGKLSFSFTAMKYTEFSIKQNIMCTLFLLHCYDIIDFSMKTKYV